MVRSGWAFTAARGVGRRWRRDVGYFVSGAVAPGGIAPLPV